MFDKEKDLILKIVNLILTLWLIGSIIFLHTVITDIVVKEPALTYEEYSLNNCYFEEDEAERCKQNFERDKLSLSLSNNNQNKKILIASGNIILVSATIFILNKERK